MGEHCAQRSCLVCAGCVGTTQTMISDSEVTGKPCKETKGWAKPVLSPPKDKRPE